MNLTRLLRFSKKMPQIKKWKGERKIISMSNYQ
jgi:hypothetical protein